VAISGESRRQNPQSTRYFGNAVPSLNNLPDSFCRELFYLSIAAQLHVSCCHFVWLKTVWQIRAAGKDGSV